MAFWDGWEEEGGSWGNLDTTLIVVDDRIGIVCWFRVNGTDRLAL